MAPSRSRWSSRLPPAARWRARPPLRTAAARAPGATRACAEHDAARHACHQAAGVEQRDIAAPGRERDAGGERQSRCGKHHGPAAARVRERPREHAGPAAQRGGRRDTARSAASHPVPVASEPIRRPRVALPERARRLRDAAQDASDPEAAGRGFGSLARQGARCFELHAGRHLYDLTTAGRDLWPALYALLVWGDRHSRPNSRLFRHAECGARSRRRWALPHVRGHPGARGRRDRTAARTPEAPGRCRRGGIATAPQAARTGRDVAVAQPSAALIASFTDWRSVGDCSVTSFSLEPLGPTKSVGVPLTWSAVAWES